ncbi:MAG: Asp-tRNA(Asn)/Glu-tRNA(Gln) amidotransferase subunit GatB [Candidatus Omnitrophota bacterium]
MLYEAVIGLEVHVQLNTKTKAFCSCVNEFGAQENTNVCPVCLGLPGSLPVLNAKMLESGAKVALALKCEIREFTKFDRKNYFYPDLPKGYQISQYDQPLSENGYLDIATTQGTKRIRVKRVHMEEDAGKLLHPQDADCSYVDFNRAGTPLLEIVSEPDMNTPQEAYAYLSDLKLILQYLDISDCDMEKGSLRCDANVSLRPKGEEKLGTKTELKNLNSFKAVKAGLEYEIKRQEELLTEDGKIVQETRLWDEKKCETFSMRSKEEAHDYRYFPDPDLVPFFISPRQIEEAALSLPELPQQRLCRFVDVFGFSQKDAGVLISDKGLADFFEVCLSVLNEPKKIANWLVGPVLRYVNEKGLSIKSLGLKPEHLVALITFVEDGSLSQLAAKDVLKEVLETHKSPQEIVLEKNLSQVSDKGEISAIIEDVISKNEKSVKDYLSGKDNALMFLVGQVMRFSKGKANPKLAKDLITERLKQC